jgi:hypothetical protein
MYVSRENVVFMYESTYVATIYLFIMYVFIEWQFVDGDPIAVYLDRDIFHARPRTLSWVRDRHMHACMHASIFIHGWSGTNIYYLANTVHHALHTKRLHDWSPYSPYHLSTLVGDCERLSGVPCLPASLEPTGSLLGLYRQIQKPRGVGLFWL